MVNQHRKYECIYDLTDDCPVKRKYKLRPESLAKFCMSCPILQKYVQKNGKKPPKAGFIATHKSDIEAGEIKKGLLIKEPTK